MFECARTYISEFEANGESLWTSVKDTIEFVLSHPNGWEGAQQAQMREAAVYAGLVPEASIGEERPHFINEGEASINYCVHLSSVNNRIKVRHVLSSFSLQSLDIAPGQNISHSH